MRYGTLRVGQDIFVPLGGLDSVWVALHVTSLTCSASGCEHAWSIEGWVHSKKRNRLGQKNVERLVRAHTNMRLDRSLNSFVATSLPWEMEMTVDESDEVVLVFSEHVYVYASARA